jgi:hypothetical protein
MLPPAIRARSPPSITGVSGEVIQYQSDGSGSIAATHLASGQTSANVLPPAGNSKFGGPGAGLGQATGGGNHANRTTSGIGTGAVGGPPCSTCDTVENATGGHGLLLVAVITLLVIVAVVWYASD